MILTCGGKSKKTQDLQQNETQSVPAESTHKGVRTLVCSKAPGKDV